MAYHLICTHPVHHHELNRKFEKGEQVTDSQHVEILMKEHPDRFVRVLRVNKGRQRELLQKGFTTRAQYDQALQQLQTAHSQVEAAQARLRTAEDRLSYTELHADGPGTVTAKGAEPGEVVHAGQMIVQVARQDGKDAVFDVPAQLIRGGPPPAVEIYPADDPN